MAVTRALDTCVFAAPLDSGNRGVEARGRSIVAGLGSATPHGRVTVFDNGWGLRVGEGAWSRDDESFAALQRLLGAASGPQRHRRGVDVAFALEARRPSDVPEWLEGLLDGRSAVPVVGVTVSGRLDPSDTSFDLRSIYGTAMHDLVQRQYQEAHVVLVPHITAYDGTGESARPAAERLRSRLAQGAAGRVHMAPDHWTAHELKWLIAQFDWFSGARMHSTIAALSAATQVCAVAYSRKYRGVFQTCDAEDLVVDARFPTRSELTESVMISYGRREEIRQRLAATAPATVALAQQQIPTTVRTALAVAGAKGRRSTPRGLWGIPDVAVPYMYSGCGVCAAPKPDTIIMVDTASGGRKPLLQVTPGQPPDTGFAMSVCPGAHPTHQCKRNWQAGCLRVLPRAKGTVRPDSCNHFGRPMACPSGLPDRRWSFRRRSSSGRP